MTVTYGEYRKLKIAVRGEWCGCFYWKAEICSGRG
jgi:hypothetical protein